MKKELQEIIDDKITQINQSKYTQTVMKKICSKWKKIHTSGRSRTRKNARKLFKLYKGKKAKAFDETRGAILKFCPLGKDWKWKIVSNVRKYLEKITGRKVPLPDREMMSVMKNICANWSKIFDIK